MAPPGEYTQIYSETAQLHDLVSSVTSQLHGNSSITITHVESIVRFVRIRQVAPPFRCVFMRCFVVLQYSFSYFVVFFKNVPTHKNPKFFLGSRYKSPTAEMKHNSQDI